MEMMSTEGVMVHLKQLRELGVRSVTYSQVSAWPMPLVVEFFPPVAAVVDEPLAKQTTPIGAEKGMPTDDEMMLWSAGGPMPDLRTEEPSP